MESKPPARVSTGVAGLDEILHGGLVPNRAYLVRGGPGTGKTTLGMHFLAAGASNGEPVLFITLGEPEEQIRQNAATIHIDLSAVAFLDLSPTSDFFTNVETYDIFSPAEVEREPITRQIVEHTRKIAPTRVFIDSMTQFRYLSPDAFQFRKQVLSFLRFLMEMGATVLFTSESSIEAPDADLQFLADGVLELGFDGTTHSISVPKFRGSDFREGAHAVKLSDRGMEIFPRLLPDEYKRDVPLEIISSGVPSLDELLHGGLERGTVTIITGPSGVGKTTLGLQFVKEAAGRGERSVVYAFDERPENILSRCQSVNIPAAKMVERGVLNLVRVEPLQFTADEFAHLVRREVEERGVAMVMIDSVAGYRLSVRGGDLVAHLHAVGKYLSNVGVTCLLVNELQNITGDFSPTESGISYLADNIIFIRYLEINGEMRKAIGVLKKRLSDFEKTLREIEITRYGIKVGRPLTELRGILRGVPEWVKPATES